MKQKTEREIKKQKWKKQDWQKQIAENNPDTERNVADLAAYLMTYRFQSLDPDVKIHQKTAQKWVRRIQKNTHFSYADKKTTQVLLDWYAIRNPALRKVI